MKLKNAATIVIRSTASPTMCGEEPASSALSPIATPRCQFPGYGVPKSHLNRKKNLWLALNP